MGLTWARRFNLMEKAQSFNGMEEDTKQKS